MDSENSSESGSAGTPAPEYGATWRRRAAMGVRPGRPARATSLALGTVAEARGPGLRLALAGALRTGSLARRGRAPAPAAGMRRGRPHCQCHATCPGQRH